MERARGNNASDESSTKDDIEAVHLRAFTPPGSLCDRQGCRFSSDQNNARLVAEYLFHPGDNIRRLIQYPNRELLETFTAFRIDVHSALFGFGQKLWILQGLLECTPQLLGVFRGCARASENRSTE